MYVQLLADPAQLLALAAPLLDAHEAEQGLLAGVVGGLVQDPAAAARALLAIVTDADTPVLAAVRTPPHNLLLGLGPTGAAAALADALLREAVALPGVHGPDAVAEAFAARWCAATGATARVTMQEEIYRVDRVIAPRPVPGRLRLANASDEALLAAWLAAFEQDAGLTGARAGSGLALIRQKIAARDLFVWEDEKEVPTCMAGRAGPTRHGIRVNLVYTPPELRRRGYASACVAALSQRQLDEGRRFCMLHADRANTTSNGIYQAIGYRRVGGATSRSFEAA